jgi:hypothetical protein
MRTRILIVAACVVATLLTASAAVAAAPPARPGGGQHEVRGHEVKSAFPGARGAKLRFAPLGARLSAYAAVSGGLYDSYGNPRAGKDVQWFAWSGAEQAWHGGSGKTAGDGSFSWNDVLPTDDGEVWAYPDDDTTFAVLWQPWIAGSSNPYTLQPGRVHITAQRGGPWAGGDSGFQSVSLQMWGAHAYSRGTLVAPDRSSSPVAGNVDVLAGSYAGGSLKFYWDEGLEWVADHGVATATDSLNLNVDEADAQRVWLSSPYWYSGKPGATVTVQLDNFPAHWINRVTGYTDDPNGSASKTYDPWTSTAPATQWLRVKIPANATPGYTYWLGFQHVDDSDYPYPLYLEEGYQVATIKPSKTRITRGTKIRVTGIVPTQGHWGSEPGIRKKVVLLWHKGTAQVPTDSFKGWYQVGKALRCTGTGAYASPSFKVPATGTFCAYYAGDDQYWAGYTSTAKVTVR